MAKYGEVGTRDVSRKLEVHIETVRRWAKECLAGGEKSRFNRFNRVRVDKVGRYWFDASEVESFAESEPTEYY